MATKVVHTQREDDKHGLHKQLGCMNGILQLFDRRYLLGLHRHGPIQNRLTAGEGEKKFKNTSEKAKEKKQKKMMVEKNRTSLESSRNSFSSSCSSTTFSSFDCSKRIQTEWQLPSEPTSPNFHNKKPHCSLPPPDIRDVVKDSMTRPIRVTRKERASPVMKHIDSPRPFVHDRKDRKPAKISLTAKEVKEISRFSCDERESKYSLKSTFKVKEPPRLSLDSKPNSNQNSINDSRSEPESNKRPLTGVVARLMGLDSLTDSVYEVPTLKIKPAFGDQLALNSPRVHAKIKPDFHQNEGCDQASKRPSVYGEMEKMLDELEFNRSGKDLRALKQILEAIQMAKLTGLKNKEQSLDLLKPEQPRSPKVKGSSSPKRRETVNRDMKPQKIATEPKMVTEHHDVNRTATKQVNDQTSKNTKATGRTPSPRLQKSKIDVEKQCFTTPSSDSSRVKKQSNLKIKHPKIKHVNQMQKNEHPFRYSNDDVTRNNQPKKHHSLSEDNFAERLVEDKPMVEPVKLSMEQPSPVSVLDVFYIEDTPSPIKNKPNVLNNKDNYLQDDQKKWNHVGIYNVVSNTGSDETSEIDHVKLENRDCLIQQTELWKSVDETLISLCKSTNADHEYIRRILLASGLLKDLDSGVRIVQLHSTSSLIKPELFQMLENQHVADDEMNTGSKINEKIRRKMIFDSVNEILFHILVQWNEKIYGRFMNGEKLLNELWSEINVLASCSKQCLYDENDDDDEVQNLVSAEVHKSSEDWDKCCYEVPGVVLDIERLIFKDLIDEVVNAEMMSVQNRRGRHCRRLFSM